MKLCLVILIMLCSIYESFSRYLHIKGGLVVNHDNSALSDVLIDSETGKIIQVGGNFDDYVPPHTRVIDAHDKLVMPGGIDPHTHLDMPFMGSVTCDDFFSGQAAAAAGGTTMHIDFALPVAHDLVKGLEEWKKKAESSCIDYSFHMAVTQWNNKTYRDMAHIVAQGINSFKFFMAYKGALMVNDEEMINGFERCGQLGALPQVHAENGDAVTWGQTEMIRLGVKGPEGHALSRPSVLEGEATGRAIRLAAYVGVPLYVVHVMSIEALEEVAKARLRGQRVIGEPVVSGLALNESVMWDPDWEVAARYVMSPPIRAAEHGKALREALSRGVLQLVATDHAVFTSVQKAAGRGDFRLIPNGVNGIEERIHVVWQTMVNSGLMTSSDFVRATSTAAAQAFNIFPKKGLIAPGSDADVIVLDPNQEHTISASTHHSRIDSNVYEGMNIKGKVVMTISRGRVVWEHGKLNVTRGSGHFVPLPPFGPLYEGLSKQQTSIQLPQRYGPTPVRRAGAEADGQSEGRHEEL
ncbi:hypothetical protein CEUSTIGMA_g12611.t1 [Chlamydomonas eustigma]|uniref:dihydropyrimidinase n=1 Tax=Chlamydomonas eustigma TaxID=1157962 RepID=A0A250XQ92_9CHLO|nr:hypothetical protein CEUSTIGMA_g12611.t1 [Chlamydomonas eustigma]|eukprot:GAX85193.1 hypothetical protein CEUSTIGMA_g12611.t1 [Chlamydomonas eustigma]